MDTDTIAHLHYYYYYYYYYYYFHQFLVINQFRYKQIIMFMSPFFSAVCPRVLEGNNTGVIYSPSFPNDYPNNMNCYWTIGRYSYNNLVLNFTFFDLEDGCYDKVIVRDGQYTWITRQYCQGTKITPFVVTPTGRFARVEFTSDSLNTRKGFLMFYKFLYSPYTTTSPTTRYTIPTNTTRGN